MHFQGGCLYVLSRDGCINGQITSGPNFMVVADMYRKEGITEQVTWVYATIVIFPMIGLVSFIFNMYNVGSYIEYSSFTKPTVNMYI